MPLFSESKKNVRFCLPLFYFFALIIWIRSTEKFVCIISLINVKCKRYISLDYSNARWYSVKRICCWFFAALHGKCCFSVWWIYSIWYFVGIAARGGIFAFLRQKYQKKSPARIMYKIKNRLNCRRCFFDAGIAGASPESLKLNPILIKNIFRFLL